MKQLVHKPIRFLANATRFSHVRHKTFHRQPQDLLATAKSPTHLSDFPSEHSSISLFKQVDVLIEPAYLILRLKSTVKLTTFSDFPKEYFGFSEIIPTFAHKHRILGFERKVVVRLLWV